MNATQKQMDAGETPGENVFALLYYNSLLAELDPGLLAKWQSSAGSTKKPEPLLLIGSRLRDRFELLKEFICDESMPWP